VATQSDLYSLALAQGLSPEQAKIAAAIGMGESGGNANAHNTNADTGDNSYGYWQINMLGDLGPKRRALLGISSNDELFKPEVNARAMKLISANGADFTPWSVYKDDTYRQFLNNPVTDQTKDPAWLQGLHIVSPISNLLPDGAITDTTKALGSLVETVNKTARWVSDSRNWIRVVYVVGGAYLTLAGLQMIVLGGSPLKSIMNVVPAGKAAKVAKTVL
jgi:hypothetical protein